MTEIERLILSVESKGVSQVNKELDSVDKATQNVKSSNAGLRSSYLAIAAAVAVVATGVAFLGKKLIDATSTYQRYNAMLATTTGSAEKAAIAYDALVDFGIKTPFSVNEAIQAYIQLKNLGLDPSERALRAYGDAASATGGQLVDLVHAVSQATINEFLPLRNQLGVKFENLGDTVAFTFRKMRTVVKNDAASIEQYVIGIAERFFGGSMANQMNTLGGAISNVSDAFDKFWVNVAKQGPDTVLFKSVTAITNALDELNSQLSSGQTKSVLKAYGVLWQGAIGTIKDTFTDLTTLILGQQNLMSAGNDRTFSTMVLQAQSGISLMAIDFQKFFVVDATRDFTAFGQMFANQFHSLTELAKAAGSSIQSFMTGGWGGGEEDFSAAIVRIQKEAEARKLAILQERNAKKQAQDVAQSETEALIVQETEKRIKAFQDYLAQAAILRGEYDAKVLQRQSQGGDSLADPPTPPVDFGKADKSLISGLGDVAKGVQGEGAVLLESWQGTMEKMLEITTETMDKRKAIALAAMDQLLVDEKQKILLEYDARKNFVLSATELTEKAKTDLIKKLTAEREAQIWQIEVKNNKQRLAGAEDFFNNLASIGSTFGKKGFEVAKAASIASATLKGYESAVSSYAAGTKVGGPVVGAVYAAASIVATTAQIAQIVAQQYTPAAYAQGGMIPAGRYGIVGEAGPELVAGPAIVTNASQTANRMNGGGVRTVTVENYGAPVQATSAMDGDTLTILLKPILEEHKQKVKSELTSEVQRGGSSFSQAVESTYGVNRGGQA